MSLPGINCKTLPTDVPPTGASVQTYLLDTAHALFTANPFVNSNGVSFFYNGQSCLPYGGLSYTIRNPGTPLTMNNAGTHVASIISLFNAEPSSLTVNEFQKNAEKLRESIEKEYCFYYRRYITMLNQTIGEAAKLPGFNPVKGPPPSFTPNAGGTNTSLQNDIDLTYQLNFRLNDILTILEALHVSRESTLNTYFGPDGVSGAIGGLNIDIQKMREKLGSDSQKLQNSNLVNDVQSAMIDYTIEKNESSKNLLAIYGFMNIVAIGLLFYLYRSAKNQ